MALSKCVIEVNNQGQELIHYKSLAFPIACYYDDIQETPVSWHWHSELEFAVVTEGMIILSVGTEKYKLETGDAFFVNAEALHAVDSNCNGNCFLHSFTFHPRLVSGGPEMVYWIKYLHPLITDSSFSSYIFRAKNSSEISALSALRTIWQECLDEPEGYELTIRNRLSEVLFFLWKQEKYSIHTTTRQETKNNVRIKQMLTFIHKHYPDTLSTQQIAASASVSASECLRCFKNTIGSTPIAYVNQYRILKACELLETSSYTIAEIGEQCGFLEMSYFARIFKKQKGVTPSDYRKKSLHITH